MNKRGSIALETAVVFPFFLVLVVVFIFILAKAVLADIPTATEFTEGIRKIDSIIRKAHIIDEIIQ